MIPEDIQRLLEDAECFLVDGLQNENLSPKAREQRNTILFGFQQAKARYHLEFLPRGENRHDAGFGQDSSDENQSWSLAPSVTSDVPLPSDLQDDGMEEITLRPVEDTGNILKQGYLEKRSRDHSFFGSEWQKRWCVLNRKTFYYYANEKSKQPKGTFSIEHYSARLAFHLRKDSRRRCCFELVCPGKRTYEFTAPSPAEAEDWVDQIQFLLKADLSSLTIPYDEEEEELYNDVGSSDSMTTASHNTTLNQDDGMEEDDIYEVFPEKDPNAPEDSEDDGRGRHCGMCTMGWERKVCFLPSPTCFTFHRRFHPGAGKQRSCLSSRGWAGTFLPCILLAQPNGGRRGCGQLGDAQTALRH